MITAKIDGATRSLGKSQGYLSLPIRDEVDPDGFPRMISAWEPTPDELVRIAAGAKIELSVLGRTHPPVMVTVAAPNERPRPDAALRLTASLMSEEEMAAVVNDAMDEMQVRDSRRIYVAAVIVRAITIFFRRLAAKGKGGK